MRTLPVLLSALAIAILAGGCVVSRGGNPHGLPPGQAKKVYGTQSARPFAPGQQKKQ